MVHQKPDDLKRKLGSKHVNGEPVVDLVTIDSVPEPLRRLDEYGLGLWVRTWSLGQTWVSADSDIELLQMTCEMVDERETLRGFVLENIDAWHERKALRDLDKAIISNLSLLGFTPSDRMRLGVSHVKAQSKLEQMMARNDAR